MAFISWYLVVKSCVLFKKVLLVNHFYKVHLFYVTALHNQLSIKAGFDPTSTNHWYFEIESTTNTPLNNKVSKYIANYFVWKLSLSDKNRCHLIPWGTFWTEDVLNGVGSEVSVPTTIIYLMPHKHELQAIQDSRHHRHAINGQIRVTDRLQHRSETDT